MKSYGEIVIYQTEDGLTNIEVKIEDETVWLSQQQMADLFQTSRTNVVEHIKHIYEEGELDENSTCRNFRQVRKEGNRDVSREMPFYNLDMLADSFWIQKKRTLKYFLLLKLGLMYKPYKKLSGQKRCLEDRMYNGSWG